MKRKNLNKIIASIIIIVISVFSYFYDQYKDSDFVSNKPEISSEIRHSSLETLNKAAHQAYNKKKSDVYINGTAKIIKILPDDTKGSQHQRFILDIGDGLTVLVAHNIDLAKRVEGIKVGEFVEYAGDYIYNPKGGILHWTHKDPRKKHKDGWLLYNNRKFW